MPLPDLRFRLELLRGRDSHPSLTEKPIRHRRTVLATLTSLSFGSPLLASMEIQ